MLLILLISCAGIACQGSFPAASDLEVLTAGEAPLYFYREKPVLDPNRSYMEALGEDVLTLQDACLRLGEDGPVILWPPGFTPRADGVAIEVLDAGGRVVARTGTLLVIGGGHTGKDLGECQGPIWSDTVIID